MEESEKPIKSLKSVCQSKKKKKQNEKIKLKLEIKAFVPSKMLFFKQ
jgi:hypothetical protein